MLASVCKFVCVSSNSRVRIIVGVECRSGYVVFVVATRCIWYDDNDNQFRSRKAGRLVVAARVYLGLLIFAVADICTVIIVVL